MRSVVIMEYEDGSTFEMDLRDWVEAHLVMRMEKALPAALTAIGGALLRGLVGAAGRALLPRIASAVVPRIASAGISFLSRLPLNVLTSIANALGIQPTGNQQQLAQQIVGAVQTNPTGLVEKLATALQNLPQQTKRQILDALKGIGVDLMGMLMGGTVPATTMKKNLTIDDVSDDFMLYYLLIFPKRIRIKKVR